ncbi:DUF99 family protein [Candidatus Bathyarchaeota archaeon]|nr:MAG: DUF99 family protein [Candidatus Bathyarchaeota archaeon]
MNLNALKKIRIVGVEDGSFQKGLTKKALLVAVLFHGLSIKKVKVDEIEVDGLDATTKLTEMLSNWKFDVVMLAGVSFAGFNVINPAVIHEKFHKPVIIVTGKKPDNRAVRRALKRHFIDWEVRWLVFEHLGKVYKVYSLNHELPVYIEILGVSKEQASGIVKAFSIFGKIPEPIRVARLIARGLS